MATSSRKASPFSGPEWSASSSASALHRLGVRVKVFRQSGGVGPCRIPRSSTARARCSPRSSTSIPMPMPRSPATATRSVVTYRALDGSTADRAICVPGRGAPAGRPTSAKLGLENTTLALDARGVPIYDRTTLQCGGSSIFVAGDAERRYARAATKRSDEGRIAGDNAARFPDIDAACGVHC